jgi:hypothetical protein
LVEGHGGQRFDKGDRSEHDWAQWQGP